MLKPLVGVLLIGLMTAFTQHLNAHPLTQAQQIYLDAKAAIDNQDDALYQALRAQLQDYPLNIYLDFHQQKNSIMKLDGTNALSVIKKFDNTPLYNALRHRYLKGTGQQNRWQDFLTISPELPRNTELQCYYYRAKLDQGDKASAWQGAENLWLYGYSRPKTCDLLFQQWENAGQATPQIIWSRMLLAFDAGQYKLIKWLATKIPQQKSKNKLLLEVYQKPHRLKQSKKFLDKHPLTADIVSAGLRRLARRDIKQAIDLYLHYTKVGRFSDFKGQQLNQFLLRKALIDQDNELIDYIDNALIQFESDDLTEMRLRWAIREKDIPKLSQFLPRLSKQTAQKPQWQYWQARLISDKKQQNSIMNKLAKGRHFYGFVAANEQNMPINLRLQKPQIDIGLQAKLTKNATWLRITELQAINKLHSARAEWKLLFSRSTMLEKNQYILMATKQGWDGLTIQGTINGKFWDYVSYRFPFNQQEAFASASKKYQISEDEIRAIARRESAFYTKATSRVGARGMMQVMPATAKQTAQKHKLPYQNTNQLYDTDLNILLGSAYYSDLLNQFEQNRILATAAYNAGPSNVKRWLDKTNGQLDVLAFIESIPFRETREYVKAVFSYRTIYEALTYKSQQEVFSVPERQFLY